MSLKEVKYVSRFSVISPEHRERERSFLQNVPGIIRRYR